MQEREGDVAFGVGESDMATGPGHAEPANARVDRGSLLGKEESVGLEQRLRENAVVTEFGGARFRRRGKGLR